ncbi:lysozyme inhibitor LprI family protein [Aureimonas sp. N4]|uniref:lysozyme inhibitor LprI family protein n=1 Tax=Aureimonas sp. N4 TaxID=1638165 RepID=UPI0009E8763B|nr:lysozyme inhibitor LprI family protein [Aureimonas sp. N4]
MQETAADVARLQACVEAAHSDAAKSECIGTVVRSCESASSQEPVSIQTYFCRSREAGAWDRLLNNNFKRQLEMIQGYDDDPALKARQVETLRVAQRLWVQFRDAEMDRMEANSQGAASTWVLANVEFVRMDMTARRAIELDWSS